MQWYNNISSNKRNWLLAFVSALLILPYIILCFYAHPAADDYVIKPLSLFWVTQYHLYLYWNGRYSSNFLALLNPVLYNSLLGYRFVALIILILIPSAIYFVMRSITGRLFTSLQKITLSIIIASLILCMMPSLPEGIYWYSGSVTYLLGSLTALFYIGMVIRYQNGTFIINRVFHSMLCVVILAVAIGFNEVQMLILLFGHIAVWFTLKKEERFNSFYFALMVFCILFSSLVLFSPGNQTREGYFPGNHGLLSSGVMTIIQMIRFFFSWVSYAPLLIASILFAPISYKLGKNSEYAAKLVSYKPIVYFAVLWITLFLCIFPPYWSTGILGQHRTLNTACFFFIPAWFLFLHSIYSRNVLAEKVSEVLPGTVQNTLTLFLVSSLLFSGNCGTALMDLSTGKAAGFDKEMKNRQTLTASAQKQGIAEISLPLITNKPASLFVLDLQPGCNHWSNDKYADFFGLKKVCCDSIGNTENKY
jgi:hypothetical protein